MIRFACPRCKMVLQAAANQHGALVTCPGCKNQMRAPGAAPPAPPPAGRTQAPPPLPAGPAPAAEWFYTANGQKVGPITAAQMRQLLAVGTIKPADMVLKANTPSWVKAETVPEFRSGGAAAAGAKALAVLKSAGRRTWQEVRTTAKATWEQTVRLGRYGRGRWHGRRLAKSAKTARLELGQRLQAAGVGHPGLRSQIAALDARLLKPEPGKESPRALRAERGKLLEQLAQPAVAQPNPPHPAVRDEHLKARQAQISLARHNQEMTAARAGLFPKQTRLRAGLGSAAAACLVLGVVVALFRGSGPSQAEGPPRELAAATRDDDRPAERAEGRRDGDRTESDRPVADKKPVIPTGRDPLPVGKPKPPDPVNEDLGKPTATSQDVAALWKKHQDARKTLAAMYEKNPPVRIVGKVQRRAADSLSIWGKALPTVTSPRAPGIVLEDKFLTVKKPGKGITFDQYAGEHYYLGDQGGGEYGDAPPHIKDQQALIARLLKEYTRARQRYTGALIRRKYRAADGADPGKLDELFAALARMDSYRGFSLGDPRDRPEKRIPTVLKAGGYHFPVPEEGVVVKTGDSEVVALTFLLQPDVLAKYFGFVEEFGLKQAYGGRLSLNAPLAPDVVKKAGWESRETLGADMPELVNVFTRHASKSPEVNQYLFLCLSDGKAYDVVAVTIYNPAIATPGSLLFESLRADRDPIIKRTMNVAGARPKPAEKPLPKILRSAIPRRYLQGAKGPLTSVAFSPEGRRAATGCGDGLVYLWHVRSGLGLRRFEGHEGPVNAVAYSADGKHLLSGGDDKSVRLWDVETGKQLRRLDGHGDAVLCVALSKDGKRAVSGGKDRSIRLWDLEAGKPLRELPAQADWVLAAAITADGKRVVTGGRDGVARVWDADDGKELAHFEGHTAAVQGIAFTPDGRQVLSGGRDGMLFLWDAATGKELRRFRGKLDHSFSRQPDGEAVTALSLSPDGRHAVSTARQGMVFAWDLRATTPLEAYVCRSKNFRVKDGLLGVGFCPDGVRAVATHADGTGRVLYLPELTGAAEEPVGELAAFGPRKFGDVLSAAWSPDGRKVVLHTYGDRSIHVYDVESSKETGSFKVKPMKDVIFSPDCRYVFDWAGFSNPETVYKIEDGSPVRTYKESRSRFAFLPEGRVLVGVGAGGHEAAVQELESGKEIKRLAPFPANEGLAWLRASPDGSRALFFSGRNVLALWDLKEGKELYRNPKGKKGVFSPDSKLLLVLLGDNGREGAAVVDAETGKAVCSITGFGATYALPVFAPDGRRVAVYGDRSHLVRLYDTRTGREARSLKGHGNIVGGVAFTPNGRHLLSAAADGTVRLWDVDGEKEVHAFHPEKGTWRSCHGLRISADGRRALAVCEDGTVRLWSLPRLGGK